MLVAVALGACQSPSTTAITVVPDGQAKPDALPDAGADAAGRQDSSVAPPDAADAQLAPDCGAPPEPPRPPAPEDCAPGLPAMDGICPAALPAFSPWVCPPAWQRAETPGPNPMAYCLPPAQGGCDPWPVLPDGTCPTWLDACLPNAWPSVEEIDALATHGFGGRRWYVSPIGAAEALGTPESPSTLEGALGRVSAGDVVVVGPGDHSSGARLPPGIALVGACPAAATLVGPVIAGGGDYFAGLAVRGDVTVEAVDGEVVFERMHFREADFASLFVSGAATTVFVRDAVFSDPTPEPDGGRGLRAEGATVEVTRAAFVGAGINALLSTAGARVTASDVVTLRGRPSADGQFGRSAYALDGQMTLRRHVSIGDHYGSLSAGAAGGYLELEDVAVESPGTGATASGVAAFTSGVVEGRRVTVRDSQAMGIVSVDGARVAIAQAVVDGVGLTGPVGTAIILERGGLLDLREAVIRRAHGPGASVRGSTVTLTDVRIEDGGIDDAVQGIGLGVELIEGGSGVLERVDLRRLRAEGLWLDGGTSVVATDLQISDVSSVAAGGGGGFAILLEGGEARLRRFAAGRIARAGLVSIGTRLEATDLRLDDIGRPGEPGGIALAVQGASTATIARLRAMRGRLGAITAANDGTSLSLSDAWIEGIAAGNPWSEPEVEVLGLAFIAADGATADVSRVVARGLTTLGVGAEGESTQLRLRDVLVADVAPGPQMAGSCYFSTAGASVELTNFEATACALAGVHAGRGSRVTLTGGAVRGSTIGLSLKGDDFEADELACVRVEGNTTDVDADVAGLPALGAWLHVETE